MNTELTPIQEALDVAQDVFHSLIEQAHAERRQKVLNAVTAGMTLSQIAAVMGVSKTYVWKIRA